MKTKEHDWSGELGSGGEHTCARCGVEWYDPHNKSPNCPRGAKVGMDPPTLIAVAKWCDEEYRLLCMIPQPKPDAESAHRIEGRKDMLARLAVDLRCAVDSGNLQAHQRVRDEWRIPYERKVREENEP